MVAAGRPEALSGGPPPFALGAAPTGRADDYALAVRVQRRDLLDSLILQRVRDAAKGEVDVTYVGPGFKQSNARVRPLRIGCSIGHRHITAGTLGCFVERAGGVRMLSNNHVLADEDRGRVADPILQPGIYDGGGAADLVGRLEEAEPLVVGGRNLMDAAVATIEPGIQYTPGDVRGLGPLAGVVDLAGTEQLAKVGRTTERTHGRIAAFDVDVDGLAITYEKGDVKFYGVIEIVGTTGPFSAGGDSGSLVVTNRAQPEAVALHFAGLANGHSVAAPLQPSRDRFQATLVR